MPRSRPSANAAPPRTIALLLTVCSASGCGEPLPSGPSYSAPPPGSGAAPSAVAVETWLEPTAAADAVPRVFRLHISLPPELNEPSDVLLFADALSDYHLRRIRHRDLPNTLIERRLPAVVWRTGPERLALAPAARLEPDAIYSVALSGLGLIAELTTEPEGAPFLERFWPPVGVALSAEHVIYCGAPVDGDAALVELHPGPIAAEWRRGTGLGGERPAADHPDACVHLKASGLSVGQVIVPPPAVGAIELDPTPLVHQPLEAAPMSVCAPDQIRFGPGCAVVMDDRVQLENVQRSALWSLSAPGLEALVPLSAGARHLFKGLVPEREYTVSITVLDGSGQLVDAAVEIRTEPARAHVVINEVLANPRGAEPAQEWVELFNDGAAPVDLAGFSLQDAAGSTALPAFVLEPGRHVLVASEAYTAEGGTDVAAAAGTPVLRVPELGKNGLSNSGEALQLVDAGGVVVSRFPARATKNGVSVARRTPATPDDAPEAFAAHAPPGASPGAENVLDP